MAQKSGPKGPLVQGASTASKRHHRSLFSFESPDTRRIFLARMARSVVLWFAIMLFGLLVGMAGYAWTEGMSIVDAFVNAAMILSGMGPVNELHTNAGKFFAGSYAIFSGLVIVLATGVVLAPIIHHVLHVFHFDTDDKT